MYTHEYINGKGFIMEKSEIDQMVPVTGLKGETRYYAPIMRIIPRELTCDDKNEIEEMLKLRWTKNKMLRTLGTNSIKFKTYLIATYGTYILREIYINKLGCEFKHSRKKAIHEAHKKNKSGISKLDNELEMIKKEVVDKISPEHKPITDDELVQISRNMQLVK